MDLLKTHSIQCPYCWEKIKIEVDCSAESQEYVEDCHVCCQPIAISVTVNDGKISRISAARENY